MNITKYETREDWFKGRVGKITGTRLKDITTPRGGGKKIGFYELVAERLALPPDDENPMDRGTRLEEEAIAEFKSRTGFEVDSSLYIWERDDNPNIAISPDGVIDKENAVEVKCLSSARHIEALVTKKIPSDYEYQVLQYFIVNDDLQKLYFCFYEPRLAVHQFFFIEVNREDVQEDIDQYLEHERTVLLEVDALITELSF